MRITEDLHPRAERDLELETLVLKCRWRSRIATALIIPRVTWEVLKIIPVFLKLKSIQQPVRTKVTGELRDTRGSAATKAAGSEPRS